MSRPARTMPNLAWRVVLATTLLVSGCAGLPRIDPSGRRILIWPDADSVASQTPSLPQLPSLGNVDVPPVFAGGGNTVAPPQPGVAPPTFAGPGTVAPLNPVGVPLAQTVQSPAKERLSITPARLLAPVGSEVILKAGVCGDNGYLRTNRRIEWMLGQQGTGQFVTVGEQGEMDILRAPWQRPNKHDNSYAVGYTTPFHVCLRRGTDDASDDVQVERGEAWITVTSPSEGVSYVTATAPESENWDARRAIATVYWVDAQWKLPPPIVVQPGQTGTLTTTVNRQSDGAPVQGWLVRYEVTQGDTARLGYEAGQVSEVETDAQGRASVQVTPTDDQPGSAQVRVTIIRPATSGSMPAPRLEVGGGETAVSWTPTATGPIAPPLDGGNGTDGGVTPPPAPFEPPPRDTGGTIGEPDPGIGPRVEVVVERTTNDPIRPGDPIPIRITMLNTGDAPAENLALTVDYDRGLSSDRDLQGLFRISRSDLPALGPNESNVVPLTFTAVDPGNPCCEVTIDGDRMASAFERKCFTVENPPAAARPQIRIEPTMDAIGEVGQTIGYSVTITNDGNAPIENLTVDIRSTAELEAGEATGGWAPVPDGLAWEGERIAPGASQRFDINYKCLTPTDLAKVTTFAVIDEQVLSEKTIAREIRPARPGAAPVSPRSPLTGSVSSSDNPVTARDSATLNIEVRNNSNDPLDNVQYRLRLPADFEPGFLAGATRRGNELVFPTITRLAAGETVSKSITYTPTQQGTREVFLDLRLGDTGEATSESTVITVVPR